ncbi:NADP-dependent phosphogluconate dehydrogenase [Candidatus Microgenomates bacterium]|nr:NADP-dependent phosphogluconate dehydrogenase [Candidatus Microgenomates bacterium]
MKKQIGIIGLGKMGSAAALNLVDHGWEVYGYNRTPAVTKDLETQGVRGVYDLKDFAEKLSAPRVIIILVPADHAVDEMIGGILPHLSPGDYLIDAGNSNFKETIRRGKEIEAGSSGVHFFDVGFSGGPMGARTGGCLMVGGRKAWYDQLTGLFADLALKDGAIFFEGIGAGHFVKMVHNGIEYGMMQALAEGYDVLHRSDYKLNLLDVTNIYNHGSVVESRLTRWLEKAFAENGNDLEAVSGAAGQGGGGAGQVQNRGEAVWTVEVARELGTTAQVIEDSVRARELSRNEPSFQGKIINVLRNQFGGHKA